MKSIYRNIRSNSILQATLLTACMALSAIASAPLDGRAIDQTVIPTAAHVASASLPGQTGGLNVDWYWWIRR